MHTVRTLDGSLRDILDPTHRIVNFEDDGAIVLVSTHLRYAWTALPPTEDPTADSIGKFIKANHDLSDDQRNNAVPQNSDKDTIHTHWRDQVYHQWNHVFHDVTEMLMEVGVVGHFHPPNHDVLAVEYPTLGEGEGAASTIVMTKTWETNVLLIPAYLDPGVSVRATIVGIDGVRTQAEETIGTFDASNPTEVWYIRSGVDVAFYIEDDSRKTREGEAAVLAVGVLCSEKHVEGDVGGQEVEAV